jgi:hypothetical protein
MQRLLEYFRQHPKQESLSLTAPEDKHASRQYVRAIARVSRTLGGDFGVVSGRHMQLAILLVSWMRGHPLSRLIKERVEFNARRPKPDKLPAVIRSTMADVESIARFQAPKYLGCYVDVLRLHLEQTGRHEQLELDLPDLGMMLELGVSRTTELSLMTLGLSRTSAIALSEYIIADSLSPAECRNWLSSRPIDGMDLPELVRREIQQVIQIQDPPQAM